MVFLDYISVECMKRQNFDLSLRVNGVGKHDGRKTKVGEHGDIPGASLDESECVHSYHV